MKNRSTEYRRAKRDSKISRKKRIIKEQNNYWHYKYDGSLSKGKIHCSCALCRAKSRELAKMQDIRRADEMLFDISDSGLGGSKIEASINHRVKRNRSFHFYKRPDNLRSLVNTIV